MGMHGFGSDGWRDNLMTRFSEFWNFGPGRIH